MGRAWRRAAKRARALDAVIRNVYHRYPRWWDLLPERVRRMTVVAGGALHSCDLRSSVVVGLLHGE